MCNHKYDDIINLPHHISKKYPKMSNHDRAAQFSPFASLTGHGAAIEETARLTEKKRELCEEEKSIISEKLRYIQELCDKAPFVIVEYFVPDDRKAGGEYVKKECVIRKVDSLGRWIVTDDSESINIDNICNIDGDIFNTGCFI
ncbi:MAG: hypothetical protein IKI97_03745 [Clostridia bacterium]|nr:hypothetical protein [Clostridia bacterium]